MKKNKLSDSIQLSTAKKKFISRFAGCLLYALLSLAIGIFYLVGLSGFPLEIMEGVVYSLFTILTTVFLVHFSYHYGCKINFVFGLLFAFIALAYSLTFFITIYILQYGVSDPEIYTKEISFCFVSLIISWFLGLVASITCPVPDLPEKEISRNPDEVDLNKITPRRKNKGK